VPRQQAEVQSNKDHDPRQEPTQRVCDYPRPRSATHKRDDPGDQPGSDRCTGEIADCLCKIVFKGHRAERVPLRRGAGFGLYPYELRLNTSQLLVNIRTPPLSNPAGQQVAGLDFQHVACQSTSNALIEDEPSPDCPPIRFASARVAVASRINDR
jgi:hypothetical protein